MPRRTGCSLLCQAESERFEDYIVEDLPRIVGSKYNVDTGRTAIAGYSMGGYGAIMLALRHPGRYRFAGSVSGAINLPHNAESFRAGANQASKESFIRAFGSEPGEFFDRHDILLLAMKSRRGAMPYLYFSTGVQDGYSSFLPAHRILTDSLRAHEMAYEYHELPGKHNWAFWDLEIRPLMKRVQEVFEEETKSQQAR
jgi:putative tributyrin esterase